MSKSEFPNLISSTSYMYVQLTHWKKNPAVYNIVHKTIYELV